MSMLLGAVASGGSVTPPPPAYATLDPLKKAADVILSNGNLDAESNSTTGGGSVLTVQGKDSGKYYFEVIPVQQYSANIGYLTGLSIGTATTASYPGATSSSFGLASTASGSDLWSGGSPSSNAGDGTSSLSAYHRIAVDVDAGKLWLAASNRSSGAWIGGGDPAAGTSPTFTFTANSVVYPMLCPRRGDTSNASDRNRLRARFDPSSWSAAAPSGFGGWIDEATQTPVRVLYNSPTPDEETALPSGILEQIGIYLDIEWTGEALFNEQEDCGGFFAWSLDDGDHSLVCGAGVSPSWVLTINGLTALTAPCITTNPDPGQRAKLGDLMTVRAWYDNANNTKGIRMSVNGVYAYELTDTITSGVVIPEPTTGWLNSEAGAPGSTDVRQVQFVVNNREPSKVQSFQGAIIGDSTIASYDQASGVSVGSLLRSPQRGRNVAIKSLAIGGATTAEQETNWTAFAEKADLRWVMIQVGLNDIDPAEAAAPAIARIQDLVDAVNATKPAGCQVFIGTMIPCYARMITRYGAGAPADAAYAKWQAMNQAISGGGGTPITGVDGRVTSHTAAMDMGAGYLATEYDSGDGIHPNNAGRQVIAEAWLVELEPFL